MSQIFFLEKNCYDFLIFHWITSLIYKPYHLKKSYNSYLTKKKASKSNEYKFIYNSHKLLDLKTNEKFADSWKYRLITTPYLRSKPFLKYQYNLARHKSLTLNNFMSKSLTFFLPRRRRQLYSQQTFYLFGKLTDNRGKLTIFHKLFPVKNRRVLKSRTRTILKQTTTDF